MSIFTIAKIQITALSMDENKDIIVGISVGDTNGIGIEVLLKSFEDKRMFEFCTPIVFGSTKLISFHKKQLNLDIPIHGITNISQYQQGKLNVLNTINDDTFVDFGKPTKASGEAAFKSLEAATKALKENQIHVLITAPINKENIQSEDFKFAGHTEYLEANLTGKSLMILLTEKLRIGLITGHIPVKDVAKTITPKLIEEKVELMHQSLQRDFKVIKPKIAVLGLNPHCGDNGVIGNEDIEIIKPTLEKIQEKGKIVYGPYAADGFFGSKTYQQFDGVLAMYHDQGLAPFKALAFGEGVNFTAGLSGIRTSPDHGTGYDIAGQNLANHTSFLEAIYTAISIFRNRNEYDNLLKNKLKKQKKVEEKN